MLYVPAAHCVQKRTPAVLKDPTAQQIPAPGLLYVDVWQARQDAALKAPNVAEYVFVGQLTHSPLPAAAHAPMAQHVAAPAEL